MVNKPKIAAAVSVTAVLALITRPVIAHGFGDRYDLPLPLNLFLIGGVAMVVLSFVVIGLFVRHKPGDTFKYPRYNLSSIMWLEPVFRYGTVPIKIIAALIFVLLIVTGLSGTDKPIENLSPTFVWIIWWVGMAYLVALVGNLWIAINPWKTIYEWISTILRSGTDASDTGMFRYPARWDVWPAVVLFLIFAWLENVYFGSAEPFKLGVLIVLYSLVTWSGMLLFGKNKWLTHGECFSVVFGFFARFAPTEVRVIDRQICENCEIDCHVSGQGCINCYQCFELTGPELREICLRPYVVGLVEGGKVSFATAIFVIVALATVTFDGLTATPAWSETQMTLGPWFTLFGSNTSTVINTIGLLLTPVAFLALFLACSVGIRRFSKAEGSVIDVAKFFVFSLIPIALAYNLAHFLSLLIVQGQLIVPLVSDPFGFGWDLFGTGNYRLNIGVINAKINWYISVAAIVGGHVISVFVSHVMSLRHTSSHRMALRGQYPMLLLMVGYTATSLWIIAQPIVRN